MIAFVFAGILVLVALAGIALMVPRKCQRCGGATTYSPTLDCHVCWGCSARRDPKVEVVG